MKTLIQKGKGYKMWVEVIDLADSPGKQFMRITSKTATLSGMDKVKFVVSLNSDAIKNLKGLLNADN